MQACLISTRYVLRGGVIYHFWLGCLDFCVAIQMDEKEDAKDKAWLCGPCGVLHARRAMFFLDRKCLGDEFKPGP